MKTRKSGLLLATTAVCFSLLVGTPVYAAEKPINLGCEEELRSLFDGEWYASQYPDVVKVYGTDENALFNHFMSFGIYEGREINANFDVTDYKEANPDLAKAFGDDYASYYKHYVTYGIAEQRPMKEKYLLASAVSNSNSESTRGASKELKSDDSPKVADDKAIQEAYQKALIDDGVYAMIANIKKDQKDYAKWWDDYFSQGENYKHEYYSELDAAKFESELSDYALLKEKSENAHMEYDNRDEVYRANFAALIGKLYEVKQDEATDEQVNEAAAIAKSTLELAEYNKTLSSELVDNDKNRKSKIENIQRIMNDFKSSTMTDMEYVYDEPYYISARDGYGLLSVSQAEVMDMEEYLISKTQYWNEGMFANYDSRELASVMDESDYYEYENRRWGYNPSYYDMESARLSSVIRSIGYGYGYGDWEERGAILEKYYPEEKAARLEYESSATCQAYKQLLKYFRDEVNKAAEFYDEHGIEQHDIRYKEIEARILAADENYFHEHISKETEDYINQEVINSRNILSASQKACKTAESNVAAANNAKEEIEEILEARNIDPSQPDNPGEPTNPDQPDNPGEPTNPDQPDNPSEPTNPDQPDNPGEPTNPDQPDSPGESTNPDQPDNPGEPTNPDQPDSPGEPTNPDQPDNPDEPINPDQPDNPGEPTNPDQPDNPGEPINPGQPDNPGEPTNPNQPKPCYPTKIVIDIDGTITVNIVSEIEASIDFDGHFGIKFQP
ncbi:hypothetical protein SAMN02910384_00648 [Pseudobutyrivibrio sp. ACV-2]|uniref:hypothetical protein n=1 Tax=Pseudobutyrivibrio sp. ACV-2 TaxID=1520801 RepID=UPI00089A4E85|nr:hypothetical protein [Pseudobutyrivibrio sp. ACV-2]SEA02288.1 hypothetical protein SAMN02910384_00648 [Pseudobutyrivibrio sp. ACV-2]